MRTAAPSFSLEGALRDLGHADARIRSAAADALGRFDGDGRDRALPGLRGLLHDDSGEVRYAAAMSLALLKDTESFAALCDQVEDGHPLARQAAVIALGRIGDSRAADVLLTALRDGSADVRFQAIASLAEAQGTASAPAIREALSDADIEVRANAAAALGDLADAASRDALAHVLEDVASTPRFEAAYALARLGDARGVPVLLDFADDREHSLAALEALERVRDRRARPVAARLLGRFLAPTLVKVRAAAVLRALGEAEGERYLERAARSRREDVRGLAREILGE